MTPRRQDTPCWQRPSLLLSVTILSMVGIMALRLTAQTSTPSVACADSDGGTNYGAKGTATGIYGGAIEGYHAIYGQEPNPTSPKPTTNAYSTYIDHCATSTQLNEGFCNASDGKIHAIGWPCPNGCSDGACQAAPSDASPTITVSVTPTNAQVGHRPGARSYYSFTVSDDKMIRNVVATTSPMMYSSAQSTVMQCSDKQTCEEKVYIIVPSNPGEQFVTLTATDSAGQVTTKTVTFQAPACATDADCGGGAIQWAGASYCAGDSPHIMQYGVAATCSAGVCDTGSKPFVKQQCGAGQVCTYGSNGVNICIAQPSACTPGTQITSVCSCGPNTAYYYPVDWRVGNSPTFCCSTGNGSFTTYSPGPCPAPQPASLPTPSFGWMSSAAAQMTSQSAQSSSSSTATHAAPPPVPTAVAPVPAFAPAPPSVTPSTVPQRFEVPPARDTLPEHKTAPEKLRPSQVRTLTVRLKGIQRQLQSIERTAKRQKNVDVLTQIAEMRADIGAFDPSDASTSEVIEDWRDELSALREELSRKSLILRKVVRKKK